MAYRLTKLDLELLGETSTQNSNVITCNTANGDTTTNGDKGSIMDNEASVIGSTALTELGSHFATSGEGNAKPAVLASKKRDASAEFIAGSSRPLRKKQASAKFIALPQKTFPTKKVSRDNAQSNTLMTKTPKMKKEASLEGIFGVLRGFPTRKRESTGRDLRSFSGLVAFDTLENGDTSGPSIKTDAAELSKAKNQNAQASTEGGVDSEVERGASNLWSMLKTVDGADSEGGNDTITTTQTSTGKVNESSQSSLTSVTSLRARKSSFLSTVLNDSPMETNKAASPKRPSESTDTPNSVPNIHKSPPKRTFRRRQTLNHFDPDATEDDTPRPPPAATLTTPRKLKNPLLTHPTPSPTAKPSGTNPLTPPPPRLCKTTGLPFSHSTTVRSTPRKRAPPLAQFVSDQIPIPTCWADATAADRKLIHMKEGGRSSWDDIRRMWREETGLEVAASTLPNRYGRVRANLRGLGEREHAILLQCVAEVEKVQKAEKWGRVAALMQTQGGGRYPAEYLLKQYSAGL